ncbi:MAG: hypothetical protein ACI8YQ_002822 [Polaribacter sp.]|jgi:hypothetical protein
MEEQILDSECTDQNRIKEPSFLQWLTIVFLWLCLVYSISEGLIIYPKIIVSIVFLAIATLVSFKNWKIGTTLILIILVLATLNIISFLPVTETISIHIGWFAFGFEKKFIIVLLVHIFLNRNWFHLGKEFKMSDEEVQANFESRVNRFVEKFASKSNAELEVIVESDKLIKEAKEAAQRILETRKSKEP